MTKTSVSRRIAWWSFLAMVFVVPLAMSDFALPGAQGRLSFSSVEMVKLSLIILLTLVCLGAWAYDLLRNGGEVRHTPVDWLVLGWLIWAAVTTATSVHWQTAFMGAQGRQEGLVTFMTYAAVYFLALQLVGESGRVLRLAQTVFWSSAIVAAYGLLQYAGLIAPPPTCPGTRPSEPLPPSVIPICWGATWCSRRRSPSDWPFTRAGWPGDWCVGRGSL